MQIAHDLGILAGRAGLASLELGPLSLGLRLFFTSLPGYTGLSALKVLLAAAALSLRSVGPHPHP